MKPEPKVFTKDNPCTKVHIWECFRGRRGFVRRQVDEAHAIVGRNAPRNWLARGYATVVSTGGADYYQLSDSGKEWLTQGIRAYLKRHPEQAKEVRNLPRE